MTGSLAQAKLLDESQTIAVCPKRHGVLASRNRLSTVPRRLLLAWGKGVRRGAFDGVVTRLQLRDTEIAAVMSVSTTDSSNACDARKM